MGIPIGELQAQVTSREFAEYWAYDQLQPIGPERADLRAGIVAATIANVNRNPKKRAKPFSPVDFLPAYGWPDEEPDEDDLEARIGRAMELLGGVDETSSEGPPA